MNLHSVASSRTQVGLPAVVVNGQFIGGTTTVLPGLTGVRQTESAVQGAPSMQLVRTEDGGTKTLVTRKSAYVKYLTNDDLGKIRQIGAQIEEEAVLLSQGPLKTPILRRENHPYGRGLFADRTNWTGGKIPTDKVRRGGLGKIQGARTGVSNLSVVNWQSGNFANSWFVDIDLYAEKNEMEFVLGNSSPEAAYLALGTTHMRAHGPFTTAIIPQLPDLDAEWRRLAAVGKARQTALAQVGVVL